MHHLSALDALFLHLETPDMPMHVGGLILLDKPKKHRGSFYKTIRNHITSRMHLASLFSRRLAFMPLDLVNPIWLGGAEVDLDYHIRHKMLPKPGTQAQLEALVATLHEGMLDRDRPLWQFTVIEGLQSGQVAFASRIHHAALDGQLTPDGSYLPPEGSPTRPHCSQLEFQQRAREAAENAFERNRTTFVPVEPNS